MPDWTVIDLPHVQADPALHGTNSKTFIVVNFSKRTILIGGTEYAGEIKKSIFGVLNFLLPETGDLPMHCSANVGPAGDVALFFGLSGTGKTTLSADPERALIGDDEHGWGPKMARWLSLTLTARSAEQVGLSLHRKVSFIHQ